MTSKFVKLSDFVLKDDEGLFAGDPCYIDDFMYANLDDTADNSDLIVGLAIQDWDKSKPTLTLFSVQDEHGNARALVLTTRDIPPVELLLDGLRGQFYICEFVGVDSGLVGFYSGEYLHNHADDAFEMLPLMSDGYFYPTYLGDGVFPIAVWAKDGMPHTFAILTDQAYYGETWRKNFE